MEPELEKERRSRMWAAFLLNQLEIEHTYL